MSRTTGQTEVLQAIHDGDLSPYGTASMQMQDTTAYVAVPIELVRTLGLGQGTKVQRAYDSGTDCLVVSLRDDHDLFAEHR